MNEMEWNEINKKIFLIKFRYYVTDLLESNNWFAKILEVLIQVYDCYLLKKW